jgi:hypothetical protein
MRKYLPALLLTLSAALPFTQLGCDDLISKLKGGGGADAAASASTAAVVAPQVDAAAAAAATAAATSAAALNAPTAAVHPGARTDGGLVADAGAKAADAGTKTDGGPAPAPTPTFTIPTNLFDAGALLRFDAGGLKPPFPIPGTK